MRFAASLLMATPPLFRTPSNERSGAEFRPCSSSPCADLEPEAAISVLWGFDSSLVMVMKSGNHLAAACGNPEPFILGVLWMYR